MFKFRCFVLNRLIQYVETIQLMQIDYFIVISSIIPPEKTLITGWVANYHD